MDIGIPDPTTHKDAIEAAAQERQQSKPRCMDTARFDREVDRAATRAEGTGSRCDHHHHLLRRDKADGRHQADRPRVSQYRWPPGDGPPGRREDPLERAKFAGANLVGERGGYTQGVSPLETVYEPQRHQADRPRVSRYRHPPGYGRWRSEEDLAKGRNLREQIWWGREGATPRGLALSRRSTSRSSRSDSLQAR